MSEQSSALRLTSGAERRRATVLLVLFVLGAWVHARVQGNAPRNEIPNCQQQIAATMVRWGLASRGFQPPVDPAEIERHIAELRSPISEQWVLAADWPADRGVRSSSASVAAGVLGKFLGGGHLARVEHLLPAVCPCDGEHERRRAAGASGCG